MYDSNTILLQDAKDQFAQLMRRLNKSDIDPFFSFILQEWKPANIEHSNVSDYNDTCINGGEEIVDDPVFLLNTIANDIKNRIPINATLSSENIVAPKRGENSDCDPEITLHVDEFLYTDDDVNELADNGKISRYYCCDCESKNIKPLIFISHSMSREALYFIFNTLLPPLKNDTVLDIGSRLGAVLYGAYAYTDAKRIIGVEMNEDLCRLQCDIIEKYKMGDRIEIINKRIEEVPEIVQDSNVIIINNSFEFYLPENVQKDIWTMLKANIKKGTTLVMRPNIETAFKYIQVGFAVNEWLKPLDQHYSNDGTSDIFHSPMIEDADQFSDIACYEVI